MTENKKNLSVPTAIIIAAIIIAGAIFMTRSKAAPSAANLPKEKKADPLESLSPITNNDHILGNPNASIKIVEYSDFECPFCKSFHFTMKKIIDEYGKSGEVAWVYRHFPLDSLHPVKARKEAIATECAVELGGKEAFWEFADKFFEVTPSNNRTDIDIVLPKIATDMGLDKTKFNECLESGRYDKHIQDEVDNAIATGGRGTPWSILIAPNGKKFPINGALPYSSVEELVKLALEEK
ncbi:TPA: disulfide bond formation protein DsbA [Patescibacteria group bacterium]|nr:MAG: Periplasmic thiol:disulfide interchange protein DsbA [Parcubacteria group bacterium GW2011_GWF2_40_10]KKR47990.1 MAG: Periplasmic thiol:disulfide interchange protein DsbA [Parcubacteria group bacterium GW2011_GWA2_40_143]KKR60470.1 MAG: Periplasmic thiol:disulfide interchange protein DsbA [Parcubacteria group bacterium GW2011_GWC2_40_31]KKR74538.1 MAG: Periplasmic thiol:disulfide interchange protein DsbA [Parcubacteria group bacterium GW2011_GWB2_40_8]KKR77153.1 MAG: Periplasmic thiol:d